MRISLMAELVWRTSLHPATRAWTCRPATASCAASSTRRSPAAFRTALHACRRPSRASFGCTGSATRRTSRRSLSSASRPNWLQSRRRWDSGTSSTPSRATASPSCCTTACSTSATSVTRLRGRCRSICPRLRRLCCAHFPCMALRRRPARLWFLQTCLRHRLSTLCPLLASLFIVHSSVYDSKVVAALPSVATQYESSTLEPLYKAITQKNVPQLAHADGFEIKSEQCHEAGYDAFMTAAAFLGLVYLVEPEHQVPMDPAHLPAAVAGEEGRIFIFGMPSVPFLNLRGADPAPPPGAAFSLTFPAEWKARNIYSTFKPYGRITIRWIDDTHADILLQDPTKVDAVQKDLIDTPQAGFTVTVKVAPEPAADHAAADQPEIAAAPAAAAAAVPSAPPAAGEQAGSAEESAPKRARTE
eukprot:m.85753 g.85753  ORF g.85753 m.85753 type:complete len:416 (+) comp8251_c0_seq4:621-1868(+)